ncbi:MAG: hypothetical protein ACI9E5_000929 [Candidatus Omnitrophota bacterium]|jgi:hypothetical protein
MLIVHLLQAEIDNSADSAHIVGHMTAHMKWTPEYYSIGKKSYVIYNCINFIEFASTLYLYTGNIYIIVLLILC